ASAKQFASAVETRLDRADRPAQFARCLLVGASLEVGEDDGQTITSGQTVDLFVKNRAQLAVEDFVLGTGTVRHSVVRLGTTAAGEGCNALHRDVVGNPIQPGSQTLSLANGARLSSQNEKGRLKGVVGFMDVAQNLSANAAHQRTVTNQNRGKGFLVAL